MYIARQPGPRPRFRLQTSRRRRGGKDEKIDILYIGIIMVQNYKVPEISNNTITNVLFGN